MPQKRKAKVPAKKTAVRKSATRKRSSKSIVNKPRFSKRSLMIFGLAFAVIGAYLLFRIFAATQRVDYFGTLTQSKQSVTYKVTTGKGTMNVAFSNNTADVTLTIRNTANNQVVGTLKSKGKKDVKLDVPVTANTYSFTLSTLAKFSSKKGYHITIVYPTKDISAPTALIQSPFNNTTIKGIVNYTAVAQDDTSITKVEFYVDGALLETDTTPTYGIKWDTTKVADGPHELAVKSYDATGNVGQASGSVEVDNSVTPPPNTQGSRFPGDPNPKVTGKAYWGAGITGNGSPSRHETPTGKSLSIRRTFYQWKDATNTSSGMYNTINDDLKNNRLPFVSTKTPSWKAMGNGTYDKEIDVMLKKLDSYGKPIWLAVFHEPEGGAGSNVPNDPDGAPAWRAMQTRIRQRMTALGTKNIAFMPVIMSYTWNPASGRNPEDWWVPGIWDAYIVDHYRDNVSGDMFTPQWTTFVKWAEAKNMPYGIAEWANRGTDTTAANEMQAFWDWSFANKKDMIAYTYFDSGLNAPTGSWELKGEQLKKFQSILKNDTRVMRINDLK